MVLRLVKGFLLGAAVIALLLTLGFAIMRIHDGPVEFFPWFTISIGGPFISGEPVSSPVNWDFIEDVGEIEIQTLTPATSRTVWAPVVDGDLYIVSGYMSSPLGRLWKQWPTYMEADNRVLIRIDGKIYEQRLNRISEGPITAAVMSEVARKYFNGPDAINPDAGAAVSSGSVWLFEVVDR